MNVKIEALSNDVRLERLKQAPWVSKSLQNLPRTFTDTFETELRQFDANSLQLSQADETAPDKIRASE